MKFKTQKELKSYVDTTQLLSKQSGFTYTGRRGNKHGNTHGKNSTDPITVLIDEACIALTTKGDICYHGVSDLTRLAIGTDNYYLKVSTDVPAWEMLDISDDTSPTLGGNVNAAGYYIDNINYLVDNSATPSSTGFIRVGHGVTVLKGKNNAGDADRDLISWGVDAADTLEIGGDGDAVKVSGSLELAGAVTLSAKLTVDQDSDAIAIEIDSEATTIDNWGLQVVTGQGAGAIHADGGGGECYLGLPANSGYSASFFFVRDLASAATDCSVVHIHNDNAGDDQAALEITQDGTGNAITINSGTLSTKAVTLGGTLTGGANSITGTNFDINGGTIDGCTIATSDVTVGAGKTLDVSAGTLTLADNQISGDKVEGGTIAAITITALTISSMAANWTNAGNTVADLGTITTVDINGGTIGGVTLDGVTTLSSTFTGDIIPSATGTYDIGTSSFGMDKIYFEHIMLKSSMPGHNLFIRTLDDSSYANLVGAWFGCSSTFAFWGSSCTMRADDVDNSNVIIKARDNGVGLVEIARKQSAPDPYFSCGGSQEFKFYNSGIADFGSGAITNINIDSGAIDGTPIGANSANTGAFSTLTVNSNLVTVNGACTLNDWFDQAVKTTSSPTFNALTITSFAANWTNAGNTIANLGIVTTVDINGGTIDGTTIATSDITVGAGKTLDVSAGTLTLADNQISGDKVEGGTIAAITITALTISSMAANWTNAGNTVADLGTVTTADINGGTIGGITLDGQMTVSANFIPSGSGVGAPGTGPDLGSSANSFNSTFLG